MARYLSSIKLTNFLAYPSISPSFLIVNAYSTISLAGIVNNQAKISESYNKAGIENENSKDAIASADLIIGVSTGDTLIYISAISRYMLHMGKMQVSYHLLITFHL